MTTQKAQSAARVVNDRMLRFVLEYSVDNHSALVQGPKKTVLQVAPEVHRFVAKYGRHWTPQPLPSGYERGRESSCFANATFAAVKYPGLRYVEGFAYAANLGWYYLLHHAWCVDAQGCVIDPTWEAGLAYFGVVFDAKFACRMVGRQADGVWGALPLTAKVWSDTNGKLPPPPVAGFAKKTAFERVAKAGWRANNVEVGVLINGPEHLVVVGIDGADYKPVEKALRGHYTVTRTHPTRKDEAYWAVEVRVDGAAKRLRAVDRLAWRYWWEHHQEERKGVHPNRVMVRAVAYAGLSPLTIPSE
jgi:hypothetical protein